jgi:hypothetical protein
MTDSKDVFIDGADAGILKTIVKNRVRVLHRTIDRLRERKASPELIAEKVAELQYLHKLQVEAFEITRIYRNSAA